MTIKYEHIGDLFKKRREERNVSLKDAENATSIRMSYLYAIEKGELNKLISPVYAQGFFKQYALFLGLDSEEILKEYPDALTQFQDQEFAYGIGTLEVRDNPSNGVKWLPNLVWIVAFFFLITASWYLARFLEVV